MIFASCTSQRPSFTQELHTVTQPKPGNKYSHSPLCLTELPFCGKLWFYCCQVRHIQWLVPCVQPLQTLGLMAHSSTQMCLHTYWQNSFSQIHITQASASIKDFRLNCSLMYQIHRFHCSVGLVLLDHVSILLHDCTFRHKCSICWNTAGRMETPFFMMTCNLRKQLGSS